MKIVTAAEMREIDARASQEGLTTAVLMENAGPAVAREIRDWMGKVAGEKILGLIGPGNNGGDGLVALRCLHDWGADVVTYLVGGEREDDPNLEALISRRVRVEVLENDGLDSLRFELAKASIVLDAIVGTGHSRPMTGTVKETLDRARAELMRRSTLRVVAVDLPSGMDADTGIIDASTLPADLTVSLHLPKLGFYTSHGSGQLGKLVVADIGIPSGLAVAVDNELITPRMVSTTLPQRPAESNKGTFGRTMIVAGSDNYIGAASLASLGAARSGAGLVTLASVPAVTAAVASQSMEITHVLLSIDETGSVSGEAWKGLIEWLPTYRSLLIGPGLGQSDGARDFVRSLFSVVKPLGMGTVLDADGLNNLADLEGWWEYWDGQTVITPHPGEMARLTGLTVSEIQANRTGVARRTAREWGVVVVLKGAFTVVASPDGTTRINPFANPALATAGTGDVLSGLIAGLMAQGLEAFDAATCAVYIHAAAGELLREEMGEAGGLASDLLSLVPQVMKGLRR